MLALPTMTDSTEHKTENDEARSQRLREIRNSRNRLLVCFLTFPVYAWAITALLNQGNDITLLMILYMLLYAGFGIHSSVKRCPDCGEQFFVRKYFLNVFTSKCTHCGLSYYPEKH